MAWHVLTLFRPLMIGLILGIVWWSWRRRTGDLGSHSGKQWILALIAGGLPVLGIAAERLTMLPGGMPFDLTTVDYDLLNVISFVLPIVLGMLSLVILAFPIRSRGGHGAATLTPRTPASFSGRAWFITPALVLGTILVVTLIAGVVSQPATGTGRHTMYYLELGAGHGMGTSIYGWYYSVPGMILLAVLVLMVVLVLWLIARPAFRPDYDRDVQGRKLRTRNVLAILTGTLLTHLGIILTSLGGTASVQSSFTADGGTVHAWTPFAAFESALFFAGGAAVAVGIAVWVTVALSAVPARKRVLSPEVAG